MNQAQKQEMLRVLLAGARSAGFASDWWSCSRVAQVVERGFGVVHHPAHVWKLLRQLGWSCQKPELRARERDEAAIRRWHTRDWPRIKKGEQQASIAFLDESGFMLQPVRRRTWAPQGCTPVQRVWQRHARLSALAAIVLLPQRQRLGYYFSLWKHNLTTEEVRWFFTQMHQHFRRKVIVVWDRWAAHESAIRYFEEHHPRWFQFERLPAYAPDLNPVEPSWSHTQYGELANFAPADARALHAAVRKSLARKAHNQPLLRSFFQASRLKL